MTDQEERERAVAALIIGLGIIFIGALVIIIHFVVKFW